MNRGYSHFEVNTKYMYVIEYVENISNISSKIADIFNTRDEICCLGFTGKNTYPFFLLSLIILKFSEHGYVYTPPFPNRVYK